MTPTDQAIDWAQELGRRLLTYIPYDTTGSVFAVLTTVHVVAVVVSAGMSRSIAVFLRRGALVLTRVPPLWKMAAWVSVLSGVSLVAGAPIQFGTDPVLLSKLAVVVVALVVTRRGVRTGRFKRSWPAVVGSVALWGAALVLGHLSTLL